MLARAVAVDGDALAAFAVREHVCPLYVIDRGFAAEVDRLADRVVGVALEGGLHLHVPLRLDIVRGDEDALRPLRHILPIAERAAAGEMLDELLAEEPLLLGNGAERAVELWALRHPGGVRALEPS